MLQDNVFTKISAYFLNDCSDSVHFHENAFLSFVIKGGGIIKSKSLMCERLPENLIFLMPESRINVLPNTFQQ